MDTYTVAVNGYRIAKVEDKDNAIKRAEDYANTHPSDWTSVISPEGEKIYNRCDNAE